MSSIIDSSAHSAGKTVKVVDKRCNSAAGRKRVEYGTQSGRWKSKVNLLSLGFRLILPD